MRQTHTGTSAGKDTRMVSGLASRRLRGRSAASLAGLCLLALPLGSAERCLAQEVPAPADPNWRPVPLSHDKPECGGFYGRDGFLYYPADPTPKPSPAPLRLPPLIDISGPDAGA